MVALMDAPKDFSSGESDRNLHQLRQPLNVIRLATANLRKRVEPTLNDEDREYLIRKVEQIEKQIQRTIEIAEGMLSSTHRD